MHDDGIGSLLFHGRTCRINLVGFTHHHGGGDFDARSSACKLDLLLDLFPEGILCVERTATRRTDGSISRNNSTHFPCNAAAMRDTPVMFPPGRFKLVPDPSRRDRLTQLQ